MSSECVIPLVLLCSSHDLSSPSPEPPEIPLFAYFIRYPNPFARHVLTVDVLDRYINPTTGQIHTKRLILKRGILPKWASKWLPSANMSGGRGLDAWIMEESVVDPPGWEGSSNCPDGMRLERDGAGNQDPDYGVQPRLRFRQGNLNHRKVMHIIEGGELCAGPNGWVPVLSSPNVSTFERLLTQPIQIHITSHVCRNPIRLRRSLVKVDPRTNRNIRRW